MSRSSRPTIQLDGEWRFVPDPERLYKPDSLPDGSPMAVPGCWEAQLEQPWRIVHGWYRRSFEVPADWSTGKVLLRFGAVMYRCRAWLNGQPIGEHEGGYTAFSLDAGEHIRAGQVNELTLLVSNPLNVIAQYPALSVAEVLRHQELEPDLPLSEAPHGKQTWYASMSGPWKSVRAEHVPQTYIASLRMLPDVGSESVTARWRLEGRPPPPGSQLRLEVLDPDGRSVGSLERPLDSDQHSGEWRLAVPDPQLWDIDKPLLYRAHLTLDPKEDGATDRREVRFGMREIRTQNGRILLNGRPIYLLAALDQDVYPDTIWNPPSREFLDDQLRKARDMGLNMLRCHIKVPDPAYVEAADEAGMLLWCELPNWSVFSNVSAARGRQTLAEMVDELGNSPSIVIWTVINEDWGTDLRDRARDRHWLSQTVEWLRELDPSRLVVDNSACDTAHGPNFHVLTDLADFHIYYGMPDNAHRWRNAMEEYAARPAWLWSPHGDARARGDEPLVLSEFGNWGLPRPDRLLEHYGRAPWWFDTGRDYYRPSGLQRRFRALGLDRLWSGPDELAEATQWHQFEALSYEIGQLRRHDSIQGYVITELTDAFWEANGLLDITRGEKVFHQQLRRINAPDVVQADLDRWDLWDDQPFRVEVFLSSYGPPGDGSGRVRWTLSLADGTERGGELSPDSSPSYGTAVAGMLETELPRLATTSDALLQLAWLDGAGDVRAQSETRLAVVPGQRRRTGQPLSIAVHDPLGIWGIERRIRDLEHDLRPSAAVDGADVVVASELNADLVDYADAGGSLLLLVRDNDALPDGLHLARPVRPHLRHKAHTRWPGQSSPWEGDWINSFSWLLPGTFDELPDRRLLDFAFQQVLPDHVLLGYDPRRHRDEVLAGTFVGWIHAPAALLWRFRQGTGVIAATSLRLSPEDGPVATVLLEGLLQDLAGGNRTRDKQLAEVGV